MTISPGKINVAIFARADGEPRPTESVDAFISGPWAAHENVRIPGSYAITLIRFGLCAPVEFDSIFDAVAAADELASLPVDWDHLSREALKNLKDTIMRICEGHGGEYSPSGKTGDLVPLSGAAA